MTAFAERSTHPPPSEQDLQGATFADIFQSRYRTMVEIAYLTTGSNWVAEDLVQDAFTDLYRHFDRVTSPDAYLRRAVLSRCTSWVRRRVVERRHAERMDVAQAASPDPNTFTVIDALGHLPARQRAAVVLRYVADWPEAEIAAALSCRPGTVKSLLSRARAQLAKELAP